MADGAVALGSFAHNEVKPETALVVLAQSLCSSCLSLPGIYTQHKNTKCSQVLPSFILLGLSYLPSCRGLPKYSPTAPLLYLVAIFCSQPNFNLFFPSMSDFQMAMCNCTHPVLHETHLAPCKAPVPVASTLSHCVPILESSHLFSCLAAFCCARAFCLSIKLSPKLHQQKVLLS